jgi:hypothetical protein
MRMNLSPQKQKIYDLYKDGEWKCSTAIHFIRDYRKRISEMQREGFLFNSMACDNRCGVNHGSNIHMYRLIGEPKKVEQVVIQNADGSVSLKYI